MHIVINNIKINYETYGKGKHILYLHGKESDLSSWYSLVRKLPEDYSHILIDLPGFGKSSTPEKNWEINDYVNFVEKFLKEMGIKDPIVVGHCFGGKIAVRYAAATKNLSKLILIAPSGIKKKGLMHNLKTIKTKPEDRYIYKDISEIPVKTLIIWGSSDKTLDVSQVKLLENLSTDAYLKVSWESGHSPHLDDPKETANYIKEFLNE